MGKGKVAVIGGGASGLVAAIYARRFGANVTVFDTNPSFGRKILKTGGGRCNFANEDNKSSHYHSKTPEYIKSIISKFKLEDILDFMTEIGIESKSIEGWIYPHSMQAKSVRDCLLMEMELIGCETLPDTKVNGIKPEGARFILDTNKGVKAFDGCILACGGMASPESGSDGNGFMLAKNLGFEILPVLPALCPLVSDDRFLKKASGIRIDSEVTIVIEGKKTKETGNLQITDFGISGICTMQLSYLASQALFEKKSVICELDFVPEKKTNELKKMLSNRFITHGRGKSCADALIGLLPDKLISAVLNKSGIRPDFPAVNLDAKHLELIQKNIKSYSINIIDTKGFVSAQTTCGGVSFKDIDKNTLTSKKYPNLGFCGEILDVCGDCGGYNLMWAISSGAVVGSNILKGL